MRAPPPDRFFGLEGLTGGDPLEHRQTEAEGLPDPVLALPQTSRPASASLIVRA